MLVLEVHQREDQEDEAYLDLERMVDQVGRGFLLVVPWGGEVQ